LADPFSFLHRVLMKPKAVAYDLLKIELAVGL